MAVGDAAIHAAGGLALDAGIVERNYEFLEMPHPLAGRTIGPLLPIDFQKPCYLSHGQPLVASR